MLALDKIQNQAASVELTEIVQHSAFINFDEMLLPMLANLTQQSDGWILLLEPPANFDKNTLEQAGVDLKKVWILRHCPSHGIDKLAQRALAAGTCHSLVCWQNEATNPELVEQLKRTPVARKTNCMLIRTI